MTSLDIGIRVHYAYDVLDCVASNHRRAATALRIAKFACAVLCLCETEPVLSQSTNEFLPFWLPGMGPVLSTQTVTEVMARANAGDVDAALALGCHFDGVSDNTNAVRYLTMAATRGKCQAQLDLGKLLYLAGGPQSASSARYWLRVAETNGAGYMAREVLADLEYVEGNGDRVMGLGEAAYVVDATIGLAKQAHFGATSVEECSRIVAEKVSMIRDKRACSAALTMLSLAWAECRDKTPFREVVAAGVDACLGRLAGTSEGRRLAGVFLERANWLDRAERSKLREKIRAGAGSADRRPARRPEPTP